MNDYDLYDVLAELGYGLAPRTRVERADAFAYKHERWLADLPPPTAATLKAMASQFARAGTDGLETRKSFKRLRWFGRAAWLHGRRSANPLIFCTRRRKECSRRNSVAGLNCGSHLFNHWHDKKVQRLQL